jgi:PIN domain nuclease of toxin-antitoxin system
MALHSDPFDRILVAQARVEGLTLLTSDKTAAKYGEGVKKV